MDSAILIDDRLREAATRLAPTDVRSIRPAMSGANSRIYRVETSAGVFALKSYPARSNDRRNRSDVEWRTLQFLSSRGVTAVPQPLARDPAGQFLLMEWIDGAPVQVHAPSEVARAAEFIIRIFELSSDDEAAQFPLASEACLAVGNIVGQIEGRLPALADEPAVAQFLSASFLHQLSLAKSRVLSELRENVTLAERLRRLIPADFGFHNVVRQPDGRLRYVDFEYFGWDDPVKLTADFLLHPAMQLTNDEARYFFRWIRAALPEDAHFEDRLRQRLPLFALRWVLILFNPFRRDRAAELPVDASPRDALLRDRLSKAQKLLRWTDPKWFRLRLRADSLAFDSELLTQTISNRARYGAL